MAAAPVAAMAFAAAATAIAGATYVGQRKAARSQAIIDESAVELNREQARLQSAEAALANANNFRKALASQVALASLRGGGGSVMRQFGTEAYSNFLQDQEAIKRGVRLSDLQAVHGLAQSAANRGAANLRGLSQFASTSVNSAYSAYGMSRAQTPATTPATTTIGGR